MKRKLILITNIVVLAGFLLVGCSSAAQKQNSQTGTTQPTTITNTSGQKTFTAAQLSKFDGQNGKIGYNNM
jgi:uncharacterized protein YcfL